MNYLRVNSIDEYDSQLMGYNIIGNKIVYLTQTDLCIVRVGKKFKKQSTKMKGSSILNFVISRRGYLAFLYKNRTIQIRRMDNLNEIVHKFTNIILFADGSYPKMKWDYDELYLIYPQNLQILNYKTKAKKGYTDIVSDYENEKMMDMIIANIMDSERAVILQLCNRLIFTIIPIPVSEIQIPFINSALNLYSSMPYNDSRRQFIAVLSNGNLLKIINLLNLKQICEIDLQPKSNQFLEMETDVNRECILIRYVSSTTLEITKNIIYKINSGYYYCQNYQFYGQRQPFFTYKFQIPINQNLTLFPMTVEEVNGQIFDYYHLVFFKKGHLYSVFQFIPHNFSQTPTQLKYKTRTDWKETQEWKEIISTFLELTNTQIPKQQRNLNFLQQQRQLEEYNIIKKEFDSIIGKFTAKINQQSKKKPLNEKNIQDQWSQYMAQIAKQRNFMIETMKLFKIEPQVIRKNNLDKQQRMKEQAKGKLDKQKEKEKQKERQNKQIAVTKQLQSCIRQMQSREQRIDAKIKQKKKETQVEKKGKSQITKEQIQKYQDDYQKFVAEFMLQNEKRQKQEMQKKAKSKQNTNNQALYQKLILTLPHLNQEQKRLISNYATDQSIQHCEIQPLQNQNAEASHRFQWSQMQEILKNIEEKIYPFLQKFEPLLGRLTNIELNGLQRIKKIEEVIKFKCSLNLQQMVKNCCKNMMSSLNTKIKRQIEATTRQIYRLQDKNKTYYEESIQRFKEFIQYQIQNRIEIYYKSRKRLQMKISQMAKQMQIDAEQKPQRLAIQ